MNNNLNKPNTNSKINFEDRKLRESPTGDIAAERMNTINFFLKEKFGHKMIKLSLDGGFTCPNRDGTCGTGGCLFCGNGGGGDFASTIEDQIDLYQRKWNHAGYLAYFQNHTNTYAPVEELRKIYNSALSRPEISGIVIATRPDCLPDEVLDLLEELNRDHFMWVELGLQSIHPRTSEKMNIGYGLEVYDRAINELNKRKIKTVTHLILGLPGETEEDMHRSVQYVCSKNTWGIKLHLLNVVRGSRMAKVYPDYIPFNSIEQYVNLVCDLVEEIPEEVIIHRLTADTPRPTLIAPTWSYKKRTILNGINKELQRRGTCQGINAQPTL